MSAMPAAAQTLLDRPAFWLASWFGAGLSPLAPGTAGTLAAIPLWWVMATYLEAPGYVLATVLLLALGVLAATRVSAAAGLKDPGVVVIDEVVGFLVTMTLVAPTFRALVLGFLVFRTLDVFKPMGIRQLERMPGGLGIVMDDFAAGVMGNLIVRLVIELPPLVQG